VIETTVYYDNKNTEVFDNSRRRAYQQKIRLSLKRAVTYSGKAI